MTIVYCIDSYGSGGVEQITVFKANALAEIPGNRVWIVYTDLPWEGGFHFPSDKIHLLDLEVRYRDNHFRFPWNLFRFYCDNKKHKKRLAHALKEINPDVVISTGQREIYFLHSIKGEWATLREQHVSKGTRLLRARSFRDKVMAHFLEWAEFRNPLTKYSRFVVLTSFEKEVAWGNDPRVIVIPNPIRFTHRCVSLLDSKKLIAVGRLESGKNYSSLIRAFASIADDFPDWTLSIVGEGTERSILLSLIDNLKLSDRVFLSGFTSDIETSLANASIFVHTSLYETFGMSILEAMECGLPVVVYDCPYGPRSIIDDGDNGFLIPVGREDAFADAMASLMQSESLRRKIGASASAKAKEFDIEYITERWMALFHQVIDERKK